MCVVLYVSDVFGFSFVFVWFDSSVMCVVVLLLK